MSNPLSSPMPISSGMAEHAAAPVSASPTAASPITSLPSTPKPPLAFQPRPKPGLCFEIAQTADDVTEAWALVHARYTDERVIRGNAHSLVIPHDAARPETAVIIGHLSGLVASTVTLIADAPGHRLPLDLTFPEELKSLRARNERVLEISHFVDRRSPDIDRTFGAVVELMRYAIFFAAHTNASMVLCPVPADRSRLFGRAFGFEQTGKCRYAPVFGGNQSVLMAATTQSLLNNTQNARTIEYLLESPIAAEAFDARFNFAPDNLRGTRLGAAVADANQDAREHALQNDRVVSDASIASGQNGEESFGFTAISSPSSLPCPAFKL